MKNTPKKPMPKATPSAKTPMAKLEANIKKGYTPDKAKRRP